MTATDSSGPLAGLRVLDCCRGTTVARAAGIFAADVIWVEPPGGDPYRDVLATHYSVFNRGKRSMVLDLHDDVQRDLLLDLVATADVFTESWRPGVAEKLGVGYADVHAHAPQVVYCSISGFGSDGPDRDRPGHEPLVDAIVGTMGQQAGFR